jgi:molybdate transport system substrate-binding protein
MTNALRGLSSKATAPLLAALVERLAQEFGIEMLVESAGGVEVARRIREGESADVVVLADGALRGLAADGLIAPSSVRALFLSQVVLAVGDGAPDPSLATEDDLEALLKGARAIGYSTGPSGAALLRWIESRGLTAVLSERLVQSPAGTPVATLVADGRADVGVQQRSELEGAVGVRVVGPLPGSAAVTSVFSGGVLTSSGRPREAEAAVDALAATALDEVVVDHAMHRPPPS